MGRVILGIVMGYIVMAVWVVATQSLAWKLVGPDFAFQPGTTNVTVGWLAINLPLSFVGAYLGGSFALRFGRTRGRAAVRGLAIAVLVVGLGLAVASTFMGAESAPPTEDLSSWQASSEAVQPVWYYFTIPFIGAAGIMLGGRRRSSE